MRRLWVFVAIATFLCSVLVLTCKVYESSVDPREPQFVTVAAFVGKNIIRHPSAADTGNYVTSDTVTVNDSVRFIGLAIPPDPRITNVEWNFGDGSKAFDSIVTHQYAKSGIYSAWFSVFDKQNDTVSDSVMVFVNTPPDSVGILVPADGAKNQSVTPKLSWKGYDQDAFDTVLTYMVVISKATAFIPDTVLKWGADTSIVLDSGIEKGDSISWFVTTQDRFNAQVSSRKVSFTVLPSSNATISSLQLSQGRMVPAFSALDSVYFDTVQNSVSAIAFSVTPGEKHAALSINGVAANPTDSSFTAPLAVGLNSVKVTVTAADGTTKKSYLINIVRQPSSIATLSSLKVSPGVMVPMFTDTIFDYRDTVPYQTDSVKITSTLRDSSATISVNGLPLKSGNVSAIAINPNQFSILSIVITAQDGITKKTYSVNFASTCCSLRVNSSNGTIVRTPDNPCYAQGETVKITATPSSGYLFAGWSGDTAGIGNPLTITMNGSKKITANYTTVLAPPTLIAPADNVMNVPVGTMLTWNTATGASTYRVQVSTVNSFATIFYDSTLAAGSKVISGLSNSAKYYWRVNAAYVGGSSAWATDSFTTIAAIPSAPILSSTETGTTGVALYPILTWNAANGAVSYSLQISTDSANFTSPVVNQTGLASLSYNVTGGLLNNTKYFWRVNAANDGGTSGWSTVWSFTTIIAVSSIPGLLTPINSATGISVNPTLTWNAGTGATSYTLQVSTDSANFTSPVVNQTGLTAVSYNIVGALANTTRYFWRVNATNTGGTSDWSTAWSFTTIAAAPATPVLIAPADNTINVPISTTLTWNTVTGANSYRVQVSTVNTFATIYTEDSTLSLGSKAISGLSNNVKYYWRVNATNAEGASAWAMDSFSTIVAVPNAPVLSSPGTGMAGVAVNPTLAWNASTGATSYALQISTDSTMTAYFIVNLTGITSLTYNGISLVNDTKYYWRVNSANASGTSGWSTVWSFMTIIAAPVLTAPADNAINVPVSTMFTWNTVAGAISYRVQVSTVNSFTTILNDSSLTLGSKMVSGFSKNVKYYWRVNASNAGGTSAWAIDSFTTIVAAPNAPILSSPGTGTTGGALNPSLSWNAVIGAISYTVQVSTDSAGFTSPVVNQSGLSSVSFYVASGPANNTKYFWRVNATNAGGTSAWSTVWSYTTIVAAPAAPVLTAPADNAMNVPISVTLTWNTVAGASTYRIEVSTVNTFATMFIQDSTLSAGSKVISGLSNGNKYYWRVNATNAGGTSVWAMDSFTTIYTYTVSFTSNGGSVVAIQTIAYNSTATLPNPAPTKTGYSFSGWYSDSLLTSQFSFSTPITAAIMLYAKWTPVYSITYNGNGSSSGSVPVDANVYPQGATVIIMADTGNLMKSGSIFNGWNTLANGTGTSYGASGTTILVMGTTNIALYAQWIPNEYNIPSVNSNPIKMDVASDGTLWFTEQKANKIAKISNGTMTEYTISYAPDGIAYNASSGLVYFTEGPYQNGHYGIFNPISGTLNEYSSGLPAATGCGVVDKNGYFWFAGWDSQRAVKVVGSTISNTFILPKFGYATGPYTTDSSGNFWLTMVDANENNPRLIRVTPVGVSTEFYLPQKQMTLRYPITAGGKVWYWLSVYNGNYSAQSVIGCYDPLSASFITYQPPTVNCGIAQLAEGAKGKIWFTESSVDKIGVLDPSSGTITEYPVTAGSNPYAIAIDKTRNRLWFSENATNKIGCMSTGK